MENILAVFQGNTVSDFSPGYSGTMQDKKVIQPLFGSFILVLFIIIAGCSNNKSDTQVKSPPIDISGAWAGTWSGYDPGFGQVSGNWEAEVTQSAFSITGSGTLFGDVDCMDGSAEGSLGTDNVVSGTLSRTPCPQNEWTMTALNLLERSTSGVWTKPETGGSGVFTGIQIAKPGGPRITFVNPSGALPGAIVTIVGTGFGSAVTDNTIDFNSTLATRAIAASTNTLVTSVPYGAASGPVYLTTLNGTAISPRPFTTNVSFPSSFTTATIYVGSSPEGVVFSPDGRKAYVANRGSGSISMINTATNYVITTTILDPSIPVQGVVASPDGKRVYVANGSNGIKVLDAANLTVVDIIPVNAGGGAQVNPQGLAVSPDGKLLYVSDNSDGGAATVLEIATKNVIASLSLGTGTMPMGIAPSPDGTHAYIAFSGLNEIEVFDPFNNTVTGTISVDLRPVGIAVTPDGQKIYVSNELGNTISVYDTITSQITTKPVGTAPLGIAISPDGTRVYVANSGSNMVSVMSTASDQVVDTITVGSVPIGIAMSPDGKRAYVTDSASNTVSELGGPMTLTINKGGTGMGTVTSFPEGINCGPSCQARYSFGTVVTLTAAPDGGSFFSGWSNDCYGGMVSMNANHNCTAIFDSYSTSGGGGGGDYYYGGCFIATAAYGSSVDPHAKVLSDFHDKYFATNRPGRVLTEFYHRYAPPIADFISRHKAARIAVRTALTPVVYAIKYPVTALFMTTALLAGPIVVRNRWTDHRKRYRKPHE
jgi:YVTN family beta-propeller protein